MSRRFLSNKEIFEYLIDYSEMSNSIILSIDNGENISVMIFDDTVTFITDVRTIDRAELEDMIFELEV